MTGTTSFATNALGAFGTIMTRYGYRVRERDGTGVRLDGPKCRIDISYDHKRSFEIGIEFAEVVKGESHPLVPFCLGSVFRECNVPDADATSYFQSTDLDAVRIFLEESAGTLMTFCDSVLQGDPKIFRALARRRMREAASYTLRIQLQSVRPRAEQAWQEKRYNEFAALLIEFHDILSEVDRKRLSYAAKRAGSDGGI